MSNHHEQSIFPKNHLQALAYLYLKNQDLSNKTPREIHKMYVSAYEEMSGEHNGNGSWGMRHQ